MDITFLNELKLPSIDRFGKDICDLYKVMSYGIEVEETIVISNEHFISYKQKDNDNHSQIESFSNQIFERFEKYAQIDIISSLKQENFGILSFNEVHLDKKTITDKIFEIYNSWSDDKAIANRITYSIPDEDTYPAIYIQPHRDLIQTLVSRCPKSGQITNDGNIDNVGNSIHHIDKGHELLMFKLEDCMKYPVHFSFFADNDILKIKRIGVELMTLNAKWNSVADLYLKGIINKEEYIFLLEPNMIIEKTGVRIANQNNDIATILGLPASRGIQIGQLVFSFSEITKFDSNRIFCCIEANPEDISKIQKCIAAFSARGGMTSHLSCISRGIGKPAVVGASFTIDTNSKMLVIGDRRFPELSYVMVDGFKGKVIVSNLPITIENNYQASSSYENLKTAYDIITSISNSDIFKSLNLDFQLKIANLLHAFNKIQFNQ